MARMRASTASTSPKEAAVLTLSGLAHTHARWLGKLQARADRHHGDAWIDQWPFGGVRGSTYRSRWGSRAAGRGLAFHAMFELG